MHVPRSAVFAMFVMAAVPSVTKSEDASHSDFTLDISFASARYGAQTFKSGSGCQSQSSDNACLRAMLNGPFKMIGFSGIARSGQYYEAGAILDGSIEFDTIRTSDRYLGLLAGVAYDPLRWIRLEGLAELGAHGVFGVGKAGINPDSGDINVWLPYVGVRPSASVRIGLVGPLRFVFGVAAFARIDVGSREAVVLASFPAATARYDIGGWNTGISMRAGFEL